MRAGTIPFTSLPDVGSLGSEYGTPHRIPSDRMSWPKRLSRPSHDNVVPQMASFSSLVDPIRASGTPQPAGIAETGSNASGNALNNLNPKGFSCPLLSCGRLFKRLEHLKRHVRTHTQERPYECLRCPKRFSRSDNLTQHLRTHEKADRGERMKTEAAESTEDDMATFLEAEVDAMAAGESRSLLGSAEPALYQRYLPYNSANRAISGKICADNLID